jgi:hypothetical protein
MAYIILFSKWLLPGEDAADDLNYGLLVPSSSPLAGKTAKAAGLAGGKLNITGISKGHRAPAVPYTADMIIHEGDTLFVTGAWHAVVTSWPGCFFWFFFSWTKSPKRVAQCNSTY